MSKMDQLKVGENTEVKFIIVMQIADMRPCIPHGIMYVSVI